MPDGSGRQKPAAAGARAGARQTTEGAQQIARDGAGREMAERSALLNLNDSSGTDRLAQPCRAGKSRSTNAGASAPLRAETAGLQACGLTLKSPLLSGLCFVAQAIQAHSLGLAGGALQPAAARPSARAAVAGSGTCCGSSGVARSTTDQQAGLRLPRDLGALSVPEVQVATAAMPARRGRCCFQGRRGSPWTRRRQVQLGKLLDRLGRGRELIQAFKPSPYTPPRRLPNRCSGRSGWSLLRVGMQRQRRCQAAHSGSGCAGPSSLQLGVAGRAGGGQRGQCPAPPGRAGP